jgi:hypothetical protein
MSEGKWALNDTKRNGGKFLWTQVFNARRQNVRIMYGAMWDEFVFRYNLQWKFQLIIRFTGTMKGQHFCPWSRRKGNFRNLTGTRFWRSMPTDAIFPPIGKSQSSPRPIMYSDSIPPRLTIHMSLQQVHAHLRIRGGRHT